MKRSNVAILCFGFFILFAFDDVSLAQDKEVNSLEISRMEQAAMGMLHSIPYRSTMTAESFPERGKEASWKSVIVREVVPPGQLHEIVLDKSNRREYIALDGKHYQRFNDGAWQAFPPPPDYVGPAGGSAAPSSKPRFENQARLVDSFTDKNRFVSVYEIKIKVTKDVEGKEITQLMTSRLWFRDDGKLLKKVAELETVGDPKILTNTTVYEYEGINIEAPVIP